MAKKKFWRKIKPIYIITVVLVLVAVIILIFQCVNKDYPVREAIAFPEDLGPAEDHILVKFKKNVSEAQEEAIVKSEGAEKQDFVVDESITEVSVPEGQTAESLANDLKFQYPEEIEYTELDYQAVASMVPNDPLYPNQWFLPKISAPGAWDISQGSEDVVVAVLDTGVAPHSDVSAKYLDGYDFVDNDDSPVDGHGHGTFVSGVVAAITNNKKGVAGSGPNLKIMPVKVLSDGGWGYYSWIASGVRWAADHGADVINMSLGGPSSSATLQQAINYAHSKGVVVVAAAGNSGSTSYSYPGACNYTIAVGATDSSDKKASFSNYGDWVDIVAPGVNIFSTRKGGSYGYWNGTSFSSPITAALAAILKSEDSTYSPDEIETIMEQTADDLGSPGKDIYFAWGRVNFLAALEVGSPPTGPAEGSITGRVVTFFNVPLGGATVEIRRSTAGSVVAQSETLSDGSYTIADLHSGAYYVRALKENYRTSSYKRVIVVSGEDPAIANFKIPYKRGVIYGKVTSARTGKRLSGATVSLKRYKSGRWILIRKVTTNSRGVYRLTNLGSSIYKVTAKYPRKRRSSRNVRVSYYNSYRIDFRLR